MKEPKKRKRRKKMGRKLVINTPTQWAEFDKLCGLHCTAREFAAFFSCSVDTIERAVKRKHGVTFADYLETKNGIGKIALRRRMMETAMQNNMGSVAMQIFLAKNWLGMSDSVAHRQGVDPNTPDEGPQPWKVEIMGFEGKSPAEVSAAIAGQFDKPLDGSAASKAKP